MKPGSINTGYSKWPHRLAVLLVCATFPLIWVGGLVTTYDAGMAVPDWPETYGYNLFRYPLSKWISGPFDLFVEHGHRLLGAAVGLLTIAMMVVVWWADSRRWVKWFSVVCLLLVVIQGLFGGARVLLDEVVLARIHGCTGPLFFISTVAMAAFTSNWWRRHSVIEIASLENRILRTAWITTGLTYAQLVLGAHLRHLPSQWSPQAFRVVAVAHIFLAIVLLVSLISLIYDCFARPALRKHRIVMRPAMFVAVLIVMQISLGIGTWLVKYSWPTWLPGGQHFAGFTVQAESLVQAITVTAHVAVGSLLLATLVLFSLRCTRLIRVASSSKQPATTRIGVERLLEVVA